MSRIGLGRHGNLDSEVGDPLDGLVNLFDVGIVLAVAFLIAGLGLKVDARSGTVEPRTAPVPTRSEQERTLTQPRDASRATGRGEAVGTVYRLGDGRLVLVGPGGKQTPVAP